MEYKERIAIENTLEFYQRYESSLHFLFDIRLQSLSKEELPKLNAAKDTIVSNLFTFSNFCSVPCPNAVEKFGILNLDENDNRSDQMNPNNDSYNSSRR